MSEQRQVYLMGEGAAEQERLAILSDIYEQGSVRFLRSQLPPDAKTVLDIGCGHGQMSCWLGREYPSMQVIGCLLYTSPSPRDGLLSRMPSSA